MSARLRQLAPVGLVLVLTVVGFFVARALGELDARRDSTHRADIAATQVRDRVAQAATLVDGVRRFLAEHANSGVTTEQFRDIGARWLGPVGLPAAAWVEQVSAAERVGYERRTGHRIVAPTSSGGLASSGQHNSYLPATLVTRIPPMSAPGIDLGGISGIAAAVARPQTAFRISATSLGRLSDGTTGLFLVQSAQRLNRGSVEPGFVVLFLPASWLLAAAADTVESSPTTNPRLQLTVGGGSAGDALGAAAARSTFVAAGQRFEVWVPRGEVNGAAAVLPWIVLAGGLLLAALAGALRVNAARRAKARAETDRLFKISPDLIAVTGFDGYFKRVNPAFETRLGYTEQEALGRPLLEFVHPDDRERTNAKRKELKAGETTVSFENRYVCKDGSYRWIEWTAAPVLEERLTYAVGRDVTERRQAETDLRGAEEHNRMLSEEQAALRRVATLVAEGATDAELFAGVAREVAEVLDVGMVTIDRYESDAYSTVVASVNDPGFPVGSRWPLDGPSLGAIVRETGRPARVDDYADLQSTAAAAVREACVSSTVGVPIVVDGRVWGVICVGTEDPGPLAGDTEERLAGFTELVATGIADAESRAALGRLAAQQAALRRVATLVARGVPPEELFAAVTEEVGLLLPVGSAALGRYDADGLFTTVAAWSTGEAAFPVGKRWIPEGKNVMTIVFETGRPVRIDDFADASGPVGVAAREAGYRSAVGTPIIVDGRLWGVMTAASTEESRLPSDTEARLASFTELVATAIANAESRAGLAQLVEEQAALRRVATLVAEGAPPAKVFSALSEEVSLLVDAEAAVIGRLEADGRVTVVAVSGTAGDQSVLGTQFEPEPDTVIAAVIKAGRAARNDHYSEGSEPSRRLGIHSGVGVPIVVEGTLWGVVAIGTVRERFSDDTELRLEEFTELVATAIANAENRSELTASRARIVAAADETRRRIERDLHDGTQQRLVTLVIELRLAKADVPLELSETHGTIDRVADELDRAIDELRELSRGIHPAILSEGGLGPALKTLARRSAIPVKLGRVVDRRLPEPIEVAAYYVVSEALANVTKHANASRVDIEGSVRDGRLRLSVRDDGVGGAAPARGSGLVGLRDRVEAVGGSIEVTSPPGEGTHVVVQLPLELDLTVDKFENTLRANFDKSLADSGAEQIGRNRATNVMPPKSS